MNTPAHKCIKNTENSQHQTLLKLPSLRIDSILFLKHCWRVCMCLLYYIFLSYAFIIYIHIVIQKVKKYELPKTVATIWFIWPGTLYKHEDIKIPYKLFCLGCHIIYIILIFWIIFVEIGNDICLSWVALNEYKIIQIKSVLTHKSQGNAIKLVLMFSMTLVNQLTHTVFFQEAL